MSTREMLFKLPKGAAPKFILLFLVSLLIKEISSEGRVVCYYTNWSVYRPGTAKFNPQNINPYLCTHLIYAFGGFTKDNTLKPFDKYQDIEQGGYSKFTGLKAYNKNLKTLLAIGGWNEGSSRFSPLVASSERRQQFIKNILKFLRQNHFDGLDLDWEYPAFRDGGKTRDKENYAQFVQELRSEFDRESSKTGRPRLLLTMAVPAGTEYIEKGYDIPKLNRYLDWFNLLSYDYHSAYEPSVNHHSPLYSLEEESEYNYDADLNIDYSVKFYLQAGADRDKLVLGIPTYGRTYTLVSEDITDLGSPADGPGDQGDATREKGYLAYYEICQNLRDDPEWTVMQPNSKAMGPYAFRGNQWVGYDDEAIVKRKAEYVVENGLGGIMFWSIDNDDFRGSCGKKPYPLIEAAKEAMFDRLGLGDNEVARPNPPRKPSRSRSRLGSSNRNNIINESSNTHKTNLSEKKSSSRRNSNKKRLNRVTSTTTTTTTTTTPSSLYIGGRSTTPPPPTTPDPGADFKCEEEGFFAHPRDCKKYFWCLDSGPSNLGIVAHQFTCPSGLYFNTAADSCDFSRNVLCKTKTTTVKPTTTTAPITTSTTIRTTTNSPRITAATSRQTFLRHTSTTEQPSEEEEYEDEDEDESIGPEEEEDPKVIKELIQLIKKVGGLEELEKQLLQQEDGSMVLSNTKSDVSSTTQSTISKSLYHKVLSRPNNLSSFRRQFETNKLARSTVSPSLQEEEDSVEVEESSKKSDSRYSSVVRNSRPSPQNAGIDKLPEFEGFLKEKPKYVTIQRTRPTVAVESNFDEEENEDVSTEFVEQSTRDSKNRRVDVVSTQTTTVTPSYVNIRRTRPSTAAPESSEVTEEEKIISSTRSSYLPLNRRRISTVTTATDEVTTAPSTGTPFASTTQRYKYIERTKSSTLQPEEIKTTTGFSKINFNNVDENSAPITENVLENVISPPTTTRRPPPSTTTTKMTTLYHIFALSAEDDATTENNNPDEFVTNERREKLVEINRVVEVYSKEDKLTKSKKNNAGKIESSELKLEKNATLERLGEIGRVSYVKSVESGGGKAKSLEDGGELVIEGRSTVADYTPTEPIPAGSESGPVRNVIPVLDGTTEQKKEARKLQLPEVILGVETSTIPLEGLFEAPRKSKELPVSDEPVFAASLGEVYAMKSETSSMVPTVATTSLPPVSTEDTNSFPETTTELPLTTVTEVKTEKPQHYIRPLVPLLRPESNESSPLVISIANLDKRRQNTRRPVLSVRRRITTSSTSSNSSEDSNLQVVDSSTSTPLLATGNTKYTRRTRPTFSTSTIASATTTVAADAKSTTNDTAKSTPKVVIRRKFGRPGGGTRRTSTAASALADEPAKDEGSPPTSQRVVNRISPSLIRRVPAAAKVLTIALEDLKNKKSEETANDLRDICNAATSINALKPTVVPKEQQIKIQMMTTFNGNITKSQLSFDEISKLDTLNDNNDIVVFVNAWKSDASNENDVVSELESAYKCRGNVSLMVIDLGSIITDVQTWMTLDYIQIGAVISKAINDFVKVSKSSKLHLIGHGMGAHIAGAAGRKYAEISGNLLYRITALDPAMLCYKEPQTISGLQRGDAEFVDVIHSSAYGLGKEEPIGDVDFFPNGPSVLQPGCQNLICAHNQAIKYFAETVIPGNEKNFISEQCNSIKNLGTNTCKQNQIAMGLSVQRSAKGNYFLKTKDKSPYGFNADKTQNSNCDRL